MRELYELLFGSRFEPTEFLKRYVDVYRRCPTGKLDLKGKRLGEFVCAICFCSEVVVCVLAKPTCTCTLQQLVVSVVVLHRLLGRPIKSRKNSQISWTINSEVIKPYL